MNRLIYLIAILSLYHTPCFSQAKDSLCANQISIGVRDHIYSKTLGEERKILVHVPASSRYGLKYPVVYLLDGEFHFESVVGIAKSNIMYGLIPEVIIVAIANTNRYRDLSTVHVGDKSDQSGGAENFTKFIESELIPYIDGKYPTMPHRTLIGHSLGGLLVANTLLKHSHLFNNYLAIDPSISWGNQKLLTEARKTIKKSTFKNKSLYVAIANTTHNDTMNFEEALEDTTTATLHLRSIVEFSKLAKSNKQLVSDWKYHPNETHGSLPVVATHHALPFLFSWFKFKHWDKFYASEPKLSGKELVELIVSHYKTISDKLSSPYLPDEYEVNKLGYMYLGRNDPKRAFPFFELNTKNYPKSANAYDSLGDYYNQVSDTKNAIKCFTKSLELGDIDGTREKLNKLKK